MLRKIACFFGFHRNAWMSGFQCGCNDCGERWENYY